MRDTALEALRNGRLSSKLFFTCEADISFSFDICTARCQRAIRMVLYVTTLKRNELKKKSSYSFTG